MPFSDSLETRVDSRPAARGVSGAPKLRQARRLASRFPMAALLGLAVCLAGAVVAWSLARLVPGVSPLLVAILAGAVWRNFAPVPAMLAPGIGFSGKRLLRTGIVLLGLQVSLGSNLDLEFGVIAVVVVAVAMTFCATLWIGSRMGVGFAQRLLIASGFSICGTAAVAGMDGVVKAKEEEVATAIALVVLFGTLMIPLVPFLGGMFGLPQETLGIWIGASTHEVAQVVAAGGAVGSGALAVAVTVKLARVLMLAPMAAGVSIHLRWQEQVAARGAGARPDAEVRAADAIGAATSAAKRPPIVPLFVLGFMAAMLLRTTGVLPEPVLDVAQVLTALLLSAAMFALGLGVHLKSLVRVGYRPVLLGLASTAVILVTSLGGIAALGL